MVRWTLRCWRPPTVDARQDGAMRGLRDIVRFSFMIEKMFTVGLLSLSLPR